MKIEIIISIILILVIYVLPFLLIKKKFKTLPFLGFGIVIHILIQIIFFLIFQIESIQDGFPFMNNIFLTFFLIGQPVLMFFIVLSTILFIIINANNYIKNKKL